MAFLLLLPLLVSGFLVCLKDPTVYCRLHRYEGQMLYLLVGRYGIYCFLAAMFVTAALAGLFSHDWGVPPGVRIVVASPVFPKKA
ncbi:hypothetical protein C6383_13710 [Pseudomonas syringae pv. actinidiae]|nr:hypothetical protein C6383_13710 [Pseudomonas syringae pv. actinidiae]RJY22770.1 hypothetical protein C6381_09115 [Pseudomonas syringae pv. actinidiae]